jgi:CheY-like chemotaxis protein
LTCFCFDSTLGPNISVLPKGRSVPLKVLLADDSMTAQNMGKKILSDAGYQVIAVSNGAQAMKKLASEKPDLVLLDVYMPGYTGLEVCERIKSTPESANTPVILCVAKMEPFRQEDGARVKADAVIIKPFEATDLVARMQEMQDKLARWRASQAEGEESVSRFEPQAEEPVDEEPTVRHLEVPEEMAAAPAFGMDLEAESAQAAAQFTGELVVEHEREPVDISGSSHLVSADGLSGVFEMQQPAPVQSEVQEFSIAAPVVECEPELETSSDAHSETESSIIAPDPAIERFDVEQESGVSSAAETVQSSEFEIVAPPAVEESAAASSKPDVGFSREEDSSGASSKPDVGFSREENSSGAPSKPDVGFSREEDSSGAPPKPDVGLDGEFREELSVAADAAAAAEVEPRPEFVVDRMTVSVSEVPAEVVELAPVPPEPVENLEPDVDTTESAEVSAPSVPEPASELQVETPGTVAVAAEEEPPNDLDAPWLAEEVALDPGENAASLEDEMKALLSEAHGSETTAEPVGFDIGELDSGAAGESVTAQGEPAPAPEPPDTIEQAIVTPDVLAADAPWPSADSLRCESEPVIEVTPVISAPVEAAPQETPLAVEPEQQLASAMAAAIANSVAPADASAPADPNLVEQAVDRLLDRLKPDLVSQILRELNRK